MFIKTLIFLMNKSRLTARIWRLLKFQYYWCINEKPHYCLFKNARMVYWYLIIYIISFIVVEKSWEAIGSILWFLTESISRYWQNLLLHSTDGNAWASPNWSLVNTSTLVFSGECLLRSEFQHNKRTVYWSTRRRQVQEALKHW